MEKDVVCGMLVDPQKAAGHATYKGKEYFFCCSGCQKKFEANPERYLTRGLVTIGGISNAPVQPALAPVKAGGVEYT
ncbi:MAG: YHS domain-containing protein, partial [Acidobacteriaceae bacterium]|nr:YHS domain-containing protein [Acidobacteriaceae bacterium]